MKFELRPLRLLQGQPLGIDTNSAVLCYFNSVLDPFNDQTVNFILKPPKVIESRTYVKKTDLKHY